MIAVVGCGNANRTDDAVGLEVVQLLRARETLRSRSDLLLLDAGTDGMAVMFAARGCATLIVVDSCKTGAEPGAIFEAPGGELETPHGPSLNLHDFRWDHALHAGRQIFRDAFPTDVTAYLIEARSLELGCELSPDIRAAALMVADRIEARIADLPCGAPAVENASLTQTCLITLRRGALNFTQEVYRRYFDALENVVLIRDGAALLVLPVRHRASGGYVIKLRTAAGDRIVMAADFFRDNGIEDSVEKTLPAVWSEERGGLIVDAVFD